MRFRNTLYPYDEQVNDDQRGDDHRQNEHVNEVHPSDRQRRQFRAREEQGCDVLTNQRAGVGEVDADDGRTVGQTVPRQQVARITEHDGQGHEGHTDEPVELTWVAVGTREVNAAHVQKHAGDHEVGRPVVNGTQDVAERQLGHDVLHARIGRRRIAFAAGHVVDAEDRSRDDEDEHLSVGRCRVLFDGLRCVLAEGLV